MEETPKHTKISAIRLLLSTTTLVFVVSVLLGIIFYFLPPIPHWWHELVDATFMVLLLSPAIYTILIRPLIEQIKRREAAEALLQTAHEELETRVADRTAELALANALLEEEVEYHTHIRDALEHERNVLESRVEERTLALSHEVIQHQEVAERLRLQTTALESAANGVIITDRQGTIEWANQAFLSLTGYSAAEVLGRSPRMMKSGLYGKQFYSLFWKTILSGQVWQGELTNRRKDGSLYIEEQTVTPVLDDSGSITHFIAIKQDITDRKSAEEVIRADAARTKIRAGIEEALSNASPDFQTVLDVTVRRMADLIGDMCLIHLNEEPDGSILPAAFHQSGPYQETPLIDDLASIARGLGAELARMVLETGQPFTYPSMTINRVAADLVNNLRATLDVSSILVIPLHTQGRIIGTLSLYRRCSNPPYISGDQTIVQDLAERVALAIAHAGLYQDLETALKQEQAMRAQLVQTEKFAAIGRMVASVAHELNNPLQTIKNCLYLIEQDVADGSAREFLGLASKEIQRLSELVDQLREVYRPRGTSQMLPFDLGRLLEDVHQLMIPHLQNNRVLWEMVQPASPITVAGIPDQIKQVFLNISLNAIEAMQPQGGLIHISLDQSSIENRVGVTFHDTGPGISDEHLAHVFEPLYTTKEKGLGLGLSISYDVVQRHGGQIIVESPPGQGTIFTVWLPEAPESSCPIEEEAMFEIISACSILVIDDEPNLRRTLAAILQRAGYLVTTAASAAEAIKNLSAGAYDLVFLDIRMPEIDGMTLLAQIRRIYPEMPVLIMTAHATLETAMQAVRHGARDYLLKPMEPDKILTRVAEILTEQQLPVRRQQIFSQIQNLLGELNTIDRPESPQEAASGPAVFGPDPVRFLYCGPFTLDLHTRYVRFNDRQIPLPPSSFDFLVTLVRHSPNAVAYETLLMESQGYSLTRAEAREMARWQVHELRKAIEPDPRQPRYIITVRDVGYRLAT